MQYVLHAMHNDRLGVALDVQNAFDAQNLLAHEVLQYGKPRAQCIWGDGLIEMQTECLNVAIMTIDIVVLVLRMVIV